MNGKLKDFIRDYKQTDNTLDVPTLENKSKALQYVLNDKKNIFVDIEVVQRSMIKLYGITLDGKYSSHIMNE